MLKQMIPELVKSQLLPPDIIFEAMAAKSLSDIKYKVQKAMKIQKEENNQIQQLGQQVQELQQQNKQLQQELQKAQTKVEQLNEKKLELESNKIQLEYQVNWFKVQADKTYKDKQIDIEDRRTAIEEAQIHDGNPYNDKVRHI